MTIDNVKNVYGPGYGQKDARKFDTWDDAIQYGNENERAMGERGNELLKEVLLYRQMGSAKDIAEALQQSMLKLSEAKGEISNVRAEILDVRSKLSVYEEMGEPEDINEIMILAKYLAQGKTLEDLLLEKIEIYTPVVESR